MRRTVSLLLLALVAGGCGATTTGTPVRIPQRAAPQHAEVGWREPYPKAQGQRLIFVVDELDVTERGWSARVAVTNATGIPFDAGKRPAELQYGLMLFASGDLGELNDAAKTGGLPSVRAAVTITPRPPTVLAAGSTWRATLSAPGSLPKGAYVRVAFGPLRAIGDAPAGIEPVVVWITDHSLQL